MKMNSLLTAFSLMILSMPPAVVMAQTNIIGKGIAYSKLPPECDASALAGAEESADHDAAQKCMEPPKRITEYTYDCKVLAHGYAAIAQASAEYMCDVQ